MAISFDINKMAMFRDVKLANADTIANLDGGVVTFSKDFMDTTGTSLKPKEMQ